MDKGAWGVPCISRKQRIKGYGLKNRKTPKDANDDRLFPFSDNTVNELFRDAVIAVFGENAVDPNTRRSTRHIHQLRKFFMSQLSLAVSKEIAECLAGHSGYLTGNYRRYTTAQLKEEYLKGEHMLYIEAIKEIRESATTTKKELIAVKDDQNKANSQMLSLLIEKDQLRETVKKQADQITAMKEQNDNEINSLREDVTQLSELVNKLLSEDVKTQADKAQVHGATVAKSLIRSHKRK